MGLSIWTTEHSDALRAHIAAGLSYRDAAQEINQTFNMKFTRNSAIGRGARMGIKAPSRPGDNGKKPIKVKRPVGEARLRPEVTIKARAVPPQFPRAEIELRCAEIQPRLIPLVDLENADCRYPYGESPYLFCGHAKQDGTSYCEAHLFLTIRQRRDGHEMPPQTLAGQRRGRGMTRAVLGKIRADEEAAI